MGRPCSVHVALQVERRVGESGVDGRASDSGGDDGGGGGEGSINGDGEFAERRSSVATEVLPVSMVPIEVVLTEVVLTEVALAEGGAGTR